MKEGPATISEEYRETLTEQHKAWPWGGTAVKWAGEDVAKIIQRTERKGKAKRFNIVTALDYGCGQAMMSKEFTELDWTNYDPGIPEHANKPTGKFDLVVNTDVMEHIEGEYIDAVLQEIVDYTKVVGVLNIACTPAHGTFTSGPRMGQDVHISCHPPEWWEAKMRTFDNIHIAEVHGIARQVRGEWRTRVKIIFEKL